MSWARLPSDITVVTCALGRLRLMVSIMRWPLQTGAAMSPAKLGSLTEHYTRSISPNDFPALETIVKSVVKEKQPFERLIVSKDMLLQMFAVSDNLVEHLVYQS